MSEEFDRLDSEMNWAYIEASRSTVIDAAVIHDFGNRFRAISAKAKEPYARRRLELRAILSESDLWFELEDDRAVDVLEAGWLSQDEPMPELLYIGNKLFPIYVERGELEKCRALADLAFSGVQPTDSGMLIFVLSDLTRDMPSYDGPIPTAALEAAISWFGFDRRLLLDHNFELRDRANVARSLFLHAQCIYNIVTKTIRTAESNTSLNESVGSSIESIPCDLFRRQLRELIRIS